jgi:parvulin-like peptidyl-prolyl isomerase
MTKAKFPILLALAAALLLAAGCGGGDSGSKSLPSDAVAVVGDQTITKDEFDRAMEQAERAYKEQDREFPKQGTEDYEEVKKSAIRYLVNLAQYDQKGDELGVEVTDEEIDNRLEQTKKQYQWTQQEYEQQLETQGLTDDEVRETIRASLLAEKLFARATANVKIEDPEVAKYYNENTAQYRTPASREIRHILVKKQTLADRLYGQLSNGGNFAQLAKKYSQDPGSKAQGGKMTIARGQTVPAFDRTAFRLDVRELSRPVKTQFGFHLIQALTKIKAPRTTPLSEVRESIRQRLLQDKKNETMREWVEDLREEFKPRYQVGYEP